MILQEFSPKEFVDRQVAGIRKVVKGERALIAVSGGVDSTACAVLTHRALGENLLCVTIDDAFMRTGEPERIAQLLSSPPLNLPIRILDVQKQFLGALEGLRDAEEKRKAFRETFYRVLSMVAKEESFWFLVQGTIRADVDETTKGIKTQHNVLSQIGISTTKQYGFRLIEPLVSIYKPQVREVARFLGVPSELSERQPFPGPGLSVRVVGENRTDKLESLKKATVITENNLTKHKPSQYFATIIDNQDEPHHSRLMAMRKIAAQHLGVPLENVLVKVFRDKATGMKGSLRHYGEIVAVEAQTTDGEIRRPQIQDLVNLQTKIVTTNPSTTRVLYAVQEIPRKQPYVVTIRAIQTHNFLTAEVSEIPWTTLSQSAKSILEGCSNVACVYYDVTPKPPATIEME
ncbi:MAG: GMP synthase [Candidatus Bathyarchaeota archaeon]|nr:MAG: GMP synthase [Candidatus Bathyarchaeota archaeon]